MYISVLDAYIFAGYLFEYSKTFRAHRLLNYTFYFSGSLQSRRDSACLLYESVVFQTTLVWVPTLLLNLFICVDLMYLVRYPFSRHEKRVTFYLITTFIISIITAVFAFLSIQGGQTGVDFNKIFAIAELTEYSVLIIIAIISIILASYRLL